MVTKGPTTMASTKEAPQTDPTASAPTVAGTDAPQTDQVAAAAPNGDSTVTTSTPSGGARPRPTYAANKVTELPEDLKLTRSGPRTDPAFIEALQVCQGDPGEWYEVAVFQSANGAKTALKSIEKKDRKIPAGQWDFEARRVEAPNSTEKTPVRWSKLFAKYLG